MRPLPVFIFSLPTIWQAATLPANDAARQPQWSNIVGGVPNVAYEGQLYGGHDQ